MQHRSSRPTQWPARALLGRRAVGRTSSRGGGSGVGNRNLGQGTVIQARLSCGMWPWRGRLTVRGGPAREQAWWPTGGSDLPQAEARPAAAVGEDGWAWRCSAGDRGGRRGRGLLTWSAGLYNRVPGRAKRKHARLASRAAGRPQASSGGRNTGDGQWDSGGIAVSGSGARVCGWTGLVIAQQIPAAKCEERPSTDVLQESAPR